MAEIVSGPTLVTTCPPLDSNQNKCNCCREDGYHCGCSCTSSASSGSMSSSSSYVSSSSLYYSSSSSSSSSPSSSSSSSSSSYTCTTICYCCSPCFGGDPICFSPPYSTLYLCSCSYGFGVDEEHPCGTLYSPCPCDGSGGTVVTTECV